ncbi:hypothetical protein HK104_010298, partial [Borealophlyctis nickersoniae]
PHALSLLDESSLGRDYNAFCEVYEKLEKAMDLIVNDYHQAFNTAIQTFSSVVDNISDSQRRVKYMRENLDSSKDWLQCKRFDLLHLWVKSIQLKEMNRILDIVEDLQKTPDKVETLIQGKFYLTAVRTLLSAIRAATGGDCAEIGALEVTRQKLTELHSTLHETLIEEIHNHVYLKSPFSLDRLSAGDVKDSRNSLTKSSVQSDRSRRRSMITGTSGRPSGDFACFAVGEPQASPADSILSYHEVEGRSGKTKSASDDGEEMVEDLDVNPEEDSYRYMQSLLEGLFLLGKLPEAMQVTGDRLPVELYYVVERTIQEADQRPIKALPPLDDSVTTAEGLDLLHAASHREDTAMIRELLGNLYAKYKSIVDAHGFLLGAVRDLAKRQPGLETKDPYTIKEVWVSAQTELKVLLYDYLNSSDRAAPSTAPMSMNDIMEHRRAHHRDAKPLFRIGNTTEDSDLYNLYMQLDGTDPTSSASVSNAPPPTLLPTEDSQNPTGPSMGIVDRYANVVATGHRLLVTPDPYNVLVAYEPTCEFVGDVESGILCRSGILKSFLEDFVLTVYLPQLEDRVLAYFHNSVNGVDAFHTELSASLSPYPLVKSAIALTTLLESMCRTLFFIPVHQEEFILAIESVLHKYYEKCCARYRSLMSSDAVGGDSGEGGIVSAVWAQEGEIRKLLVQNTFYREGKINWEFNQGLSQKETHVEMKLKKERSFHRSELIFDVRKLQALANLHHSIGNYFLEDESYEPDPYIGLLNHDLTTIEETMSSILPERRTRFLFDGLAHLITHILIFNLKHIKRVNTPGVSKLVRNVQSLQQNLTNIASVHEKRLERARWYFELLGLSGEDLIRYMETTPGRFTFDEYKVVLDLLFYDALSDEASSQPQRKVYAECLRRMKDYFVRHR